MSWISCKTQWFYIELDSEVGVVYFKESIFSNILLTGFYFFKFVDRRLHSNIESQGFLSCSKYHKDNSKFEAILLK